MTPIYDNRIVGWVGVKLGLDFGAVSKGIGLGLDGEIIAGVVYNNFCEDKAGSIFCMEMSIATVDKRWANSKTLRLFFAYPFIQLGVKRVQATALSGDSETRAFLDRLGFVFEGIAREAHPLGGDSAVYSMLPEECRWLGEKEHGQVV